MGSYSEGNASRLGNELNQTFNTLAGGAMKKAAGKWLIELGLASEKDMEVMGGGNVRFKQGIKNQAEFENNQKAWALGTLMPAMEHKGVVSHDKVDARMNMMRAEELKQNPGAEIDEHYLRQRAEEALIAAYLSKAGFRTTVSDNLAHLIGLQRLIERDSKAMDEASGLGAGERIAQNPVAAWKELAESLSTLAGVVGSPAVQAIGPHLDSMARGIAGWAQSLAEWQKNNPTLAKIGSGAAIAGMGAGGLALINGALNGFGLKGSAVALDGSAAALTAAAGRLGVAGVAGAVGGGGAGAAGAAGAAAGATRLGMLTGLARIAPWAALGVGAIGGVMYGMDQIGAPRRPATGRGQGKLYADPFLGISGEGIHDGDAHTLSGFSTDRGYWRQGGGRAGGKTWVPLPPKPVSDEWSPAQPEGWGVRSGGEDAPPGEWKGASAASILSTLMSLFG